MGCSRYHGLVEEWLDGELSAEEHAALERHLRDCAACARFLEERHLLGMAVKKSLQESAAGLRFRPRAASELVTNREQPGRMPWPHSGRRALLALTASVLVLLLFIFHPWTKTRKGSAAENLPTMVITVSDSLDVVDESIISGRIDGSAYIIHLQVSAVKISDRT